MTNEAKSVAAAIIPSALKLFIIATPHHSPSGVEKRKCFRSASLM
jgi:hypothetical protein